MAGTSPAMTNHNIADSSARRGLALLHDLALKL
jgi:hypothetical protein